jgi:hypothetical protein
VRQRRRRIDDVPKTWRSKCGDGLLQGLQLVMAANCGFSADLSGPVADRAIFHADNAYFLEDVAITSYRCKTCCRLLLRSTDQRICGELPKTFAKSMSLLSLDWLMSGI